MKKVKAIKTQQGVVAGNEYDVDDLAALAMEAEGVIEPLPKPKEAPKKKGSGEECSAKSKNK